MHVFTLFALFSTRVFLFFTVVLYYIHPAGFNGGDELVLGDAAA